MAMTAAERAKLYRDARRVSRDADTVTFVTDCDADRHEIVTNEQEAVTETVTLDARLSDEVDHFGVRVRLRICTECPGRTFRDLISHSAHLATHNPSPAQWTEAYNRMQAAKEKQPRA